MCNACMALLVLTGLIKTTHEWNEKRWHDLYCLYYLHQTHTHPSPGSKPSCLAYVECVDLHVLPDRGRRDREPPLAKRFRETREREPLNVMTFMCCWTVQLEDDTVNPHSRRGTVKYMTVHP